MTAILPRRMLPTGRRLRRWVRRSPIASAVIGSTAVVLLFGAAAWCAYDWYTVAGFLKARWSSVLAVVLLAGMAVQGARPVRRRRRR